MSEQLQAKMQAGLGGGRLINNDLLQYHKSDLWARNLGLAKNATALLEALLTTKARGEMLLKLYCFKYLNNKSEIR